MLDPYSRHNSEVIAKKDMFYALNGSGTVLVVNRLAINACVFVFWSIAGV